MEQPTEAIFDENDGSQASQSWKMLPLARPPRHSEHRRISIRSRRTIRNMVDRKWMVLQVLSPPSFLPFPPLSLARLLQIPFPTPQTLTPLPQQPYLPWGDGFNVAATNTAQISMSHTPNTPSNWTSSVVFDANTAKNSFPLGNKNSNQAILAIESTGVTWTFGELSWEDIVIAMNTTQTAWCTKPPENYNSATKYTSTGGKAPVCGGETTCTIDKIVMQGPA
ncbi:hypothetical protein BDZ45DRAFT_440351 [Acephala macrosclerotiorum]|nr:hypothetical protein BDZ45DRAFT_440351 [Acephala macrosclerotiorum]